MLAFARRVPPLTAAETLAVRDMLAQWEIVKRGDPMIRRLLNEE